MDDEKFVRPVINRPHSYLQPFREVLKSIELQTIAPRPVTYKGVAFRSKLEARYSRHLTWMGDDWVYEPRVYGRPGKRYLPDFEIRGGNRPKFIEVKPTMAEAPAAARKMMVIWDTVPDALLMVVCEEHGAVYSALKGERWRRGSERWTV